MRRPVATLTAFTCLAGLGLPAAWRMPLELLPDVDHPRLQVLTAWPGASPEQVESMVSAPVEAAAREVGRVRSVGSISYAGRSIVTVEFEPGTGMEFARLDLNERLLALARALPPGTHPPEVEPWVPRDLAAERALLVYTVAGQRVLGALREYAERELAPDLASITGVGAVDVVGGSSLTVEVRLRPDRMRALGITPEEVRRVLTSGLDLAGEGGTLREGGRAFTIAVEDQAERIADVEGLVIRPEGVGPAIRVGEVARVVRTWDEPRELHRLDGVPAVTLHLYRLPGTSAIEVADRVRDRVEGLRRTMPTGTRVVEDYDGSGPIRREIGELRDRALLSTVAVFIVLFLAFRRWRPVLVVGATILGCVLVTLDLMALSGLSLNLLTLAGLAMGVGLIDDNAIVVLESVAARPVGVAGVSRRENREAVRTGARQVAPPLLAASLTNLIVFVPFLYLQGELRAYYVPFAMTVGLSLLVSLIAAFTVIPTLAARGGPLRAIRSARPSAPRSRRRIRARDLYRETIVRTLRRPRSTLGLAFLLFAGTGWMFRENVPQGRTWAALGDQSFLSVQIRLPPGATLGQADEVARRLESHLQGIPAVERRDTRVGVGHASIHVTFADSLDGTPVPLAVKDLLIARSRSLGGAEIRVHGFGPGFEGAGGAAPPYALELRGYDYSALERMTRDLAERLERLPRVRDVDPNAAGRWFDRERETELVLTPDRELLAGYGIHAADLVRRVRSLDGGRIPGTIALAGLEADLSLGIEGREPDVGALLDLPLASERRAPLRIANLAGIHERTTMARIVRRDQQYQRIVTWEFQGPRKLGDRARDAVVAATVLPAGYTLEGEGSSWEYEEGEKAQLALVVAVALALVYLVTAALFESVRAPLVVLAAVPLSLIGVFIVYLHSGEIFTREAWIGVVMMAGIVVNNAILLVDRIGSLRRGAEGPPLGLHEAAARGALDRVRPILMTTGTTVLGLLPLVLFSDSGTESLWTTLAMTTIAGLCSSTLLVLGTVPALYVVVRPSVARAVSESTRR